jgi:muramoyltetrapeptide carboxypeptidase LdcA involved in peptidoglycan recycling
MLERAGFRVKLGSLTSSGRSEGYRSGTARDRADEILELFADREVHGLMSTVGGYNTSSLVDLLDYPLIQSNPKVVCGYSDVTSLHCALMTRAGLSTFYGPAVFPSFGEWPVPPQETLESFLDAVARPWKGPRCIGRPQRWSRHFRDATNGAWKKEPRMWTEGEGWTVVRPGQVTAPVFAVNLDTLLTHAGTETFPDFTGAILLLEMMDAPLGTTERCLVHLARLGVFDKIKALLWGRIENPDSNATDERYQTLLRECVPGHVPLVTQVDVSHTVPMLTLGQGTLVSLDAPEGGTATLTILEPMVEG